MPCIYIRCSNELREALKELAYQKRTSVNSLATDLIARAILNNPKAKRVYVAVGSKGK